MSFPFNFTKISKGRHFTVAWSKILKLLPGTSFDTGFQKNVLVILHLFLTLRLLLSCFFTNRAKGTILRSFYQNQIYIIVKQNDQSVLFLGVFLDENLCLKEHIKYSESKIAKNIGLLYIDKHSLLSLYHSYIHSYINYGNITWGSTARTNLKKIYSQQKHAIRIVYSKDRLTHTRELFKDVKFLMYIK